MRFSSYQRAYWIFLPILAFVVGAVGYLVSPVFGIILALITAVFGLVYGWVTFKLMQDRLDEYGGRIPVPGWWGIVGFDLVDDVHQSVDYPVSSRTETQFPVVSSDVIPSNLMRCPICGALHSKSNESTHCGVCGGLIPPSSAV